MVGYMFSRIISKILVRSIFLRCESFNSPKTSQTNTPSMIATKRDPALQNIGIPSFTEKSKPTPGEWKFADALITLDSLYYYKQQTKLACLSSGIIWPI